MGFSVSQENTTTSTQNVHFIDGDAPWTYDISATPDETAKLNGFDDAGLGQFLSRPIKIRSYQWTPGTQLFQTFNPWTDFFSNADIKEKINRYRNLRCKLNLKVLINGNSFYYGRALLSYNPYLFNDSVTMNRAFFIQDLIAASNKPHLLLDPCSSEGGHLALPFIWPENYLDITNVGWEQYMGRCIIHDFDVLRHANGGTDPITVSIFAWAEDVSLCIPTTMSVQSSSSSTPVMLDEFGFPLPFTHQGQSKTQKKPTKKASNTDKSEFTTDGLISKPASAIAKAANCLTMVPYIGPYAKATSMISSKIGEVARIFGYSRPQILKDPDVVVPRYFGNTVNSDAPENVVKLSLDSKNELSIDTRTMGLGGADELTINSITSRPTFWRQFSWPETAVADTLLVSMQVQPICVHRLAASPVVEIHQTALSFATLPFECWQGTIKFHFKVVCSEYHRGRLRLVYNPKAVPVGAVPYNQVYSTIVDISQDREFDYECKWADVKAWAKVNDNIDTVNSFATFAPVSVDDTTNGSLSVYVVNELATPSITAADVNIQVWVSGGDDFAVSVPSKNLQELSYFQQQSEEGEATVSSNDNSNNPIGGNAVESYGTIEAPLALDDNQYLVYQGERIVSFKDLLRRYQFHSYFRLYQAATSYALFRISLAGMPFFRGWDPGGRDQGVASTAANEPYSFCSMTLLNYLAPAFVCQRGALRYKFFKAGTQADYPVKELLMATRMSCRTRTFFTQGYDSINTSGTDGVARKSIMDTASNWGSTLGTQVVPASLVNGLEVELPFYSVGQRFRPARYLEMSAIGDHQGVTITGETNSLTKGQTNGLLSFVSVGEDFTLGMFVGAPVIYKYADPTPV
jgi:hypothetical protein